MGWLPRAHCTSCAVRRLIIPCHPPCAKQTPSTSKLSGGDHKRDTATQACKSKNKSVKDSARSAHSHMQHVDQGRSCTTELRTQTSRRAQRLQCVPSSSDSIIAITRIVTALENLLRHFP